ARQRLGLPAHAVVVGAVGRLTYQKAPEDFLAALDRLARPDVLGVWIGDGELGASLRNGGGRVRFVGERDDVAALLPAFDVFVQPSRYEGLPLAVVEAMRCGVPVVATAVNAVPDVVVPGETGLLVAPQRPDQLAAAVSYLIDHPEEATRMAAEAREWVAGRHREQDLAAALVTACGAEAGTGHGIERRRCGGAAAKSRSGGGIRRIGANLVGSGMRVPAHGCRVRAEIGRASWRSIMWCAR